MLPVFLLDLVVLAFDVELVEEADDLWYVYSLGARDAVSAARAADVS